MDFYKDKRVLVTGSTGFKGSWLSLWLHELGADVIGFGLPPKTNRDNYHVCGLKDKIYQVYGDICEYREIESVVDDYTPDIIFHLAAQALILESYTDPRGTVETNVLGTTNILESIRNNGKVKAAVLITSDKCYENYERDVPYTETDRLGGKDLYSASKAATELIISAYRKSFFHTSDVCPIASARAGNVIGGGDWSENRLIPDCIRALENQQPILIRNPGSVRPWQYVLDPLFGYLLLGEKLCTGKQRYAEPWNFAPVLTKEDTVERVVTEVIRWWGNGEYIITGTKDEKECGLLLLDSTKSNIRLGWRPIVPMHKAIQLTVEDYQTRGMSTAQVYNQRCNHIHEYMKVQDGGCSS